MLWKRIGQRWKRIWRQLKRQRGITGIETAIILIAFVVVASIFSYSILSAGIFSSEKSKEAVFAGIDSARSSMELRGGVIALDTNNDDTVNEIHFLISNTLAGPGVDFTKSADSNNDGLLSDEETKTHTLVITYTDSGQRIDDINWERKPVGRDDGDAMLETGEKFEITVFTTGLTNSLVSNQVFHLELKPGKGATLIFERLIPLNVDPIMDLK